MNYSVPFVSNDHSFEMELAAIEAMVSSIASSGMNNIIQQSTASASTSFNPLIVPHATPYSTPSLANIPSLPSNYNIMPNDMMEVSDTFVFNEMSPFTINDKMAVQTVSTSIPFTSTAAAPLMNPSTLNMKMSSSSITKQKASSSFVTNPNVLETAIRNAMDSMLNIFETGY